MSPGFLGCTDCLKKIKGLILYQKTGVIESLRECLLLFKKIRLKNLLERDKIFFSTTYNMIIMMPMLEMVDSHVRFIDEALYIYREYPDNQKANSKKKQHEIADVIVQIPKYKSICGDEEIFVAN